MTKSLIEETFALHCKAHKVDVVREYKFHRTRRWRFDFAIPKLMIAIECEGAIWTQGRHTRGSGVIGDMEKYNHAAAAGWFVFRFDGASIQNGTAIMFIVGVLKNLRVTQ